MSLERSMNDLEDHMSSARYEFDTLREKIERELEDVNDEISVLKDENDTLREQNELLEEQVEDLNKRNAIFELENMELRLRIEVYAVEL
jgi:polyhydroxyalkanoate synthesis regulator phasin